MQPRRRISNPCGSVRFAYPRYSCLRRCTAPTTHKASPPPSKRTRTGATDSHRYTRWIRGVNGQSRGRGGSVVGAESPTDRGAVRSKSATGNEAGAHGLKGAGWWRAVAMVIGSPADDGPAGSSPAGMLSAGAHGLEPVRLEEWRLFPSTAPFRSLASRTCARPRHSRTERCPVGARIARPCFVPNRQAFRRSAHRTRDTRLSTLTERRLSAHPPVRPHSIPSKQAFHRCELRTSATSPR